MGVTNSIRNKDGYWINSNIFTEEAAHFRKYGYYCAAPSDSLEYEMYWEEQLRRCIDGYESGGAFITGNHYNYLNFSRIKKSAESTKRGVNSKRKDTDFPSFYDGDYDYYHILDIARHGCTQEYLKQLWLENNPLQIDGGHHLIVGKARRKGYSYKNAAIVANVYNTDRDSISLLGAYESKYLYPAGTMEMVMSNLNFMNQFTAWGKKRDFVNQVAHIKASFKEEEHGVPVEKGYKSQVICVTFNGNTEAAKGKDATLILFEEAGVFDNLKASYLATKATVEDGMYVTGQMVVFGCVCAGTKVWTKEGKLINIENLVQTDGLIGYDGEKATAQDINWFKAPAKKPCYRITTDANTVLECSDDHPLLMTRRKMGKSVNKIIQKTSIYQEAKHLQINDQLLIPEKIDVFGNETIIDARLFGLLIGDGNYTKGASPTLSVSEKEIFDYLLTNDYIGNIHKTYNITDTREYNQITIKNITGKLVANGMYGQVKFDKRLPNDIHTYNKESLAELLAGYFDADGNVYYNKKTGLVRIVLTSVVKELLIEVKYYLTKFGINCSIIKEDRKIKCIGYEGAKDYIYRLYITQQQDLALFKDNIKLVLSNNIDKLSFIKYSKYKLFNTLFEINPLNNKEGYFISDTLKNLRYETIKSIEFIGEQNVYNLNCSPNHNYISNGFITRQTGGNMDSGSKDFSEMFYSPEQFNAVSFENIWDEDSNGTFCSFFVPQWKNKTGLIDTQGNSLKKEALEFDNKIRLGISSSANSSGTLVSHAQENPNSPAEAFVVKSFNDFPIHELNARLSKLKRDNKYIKYGQPVSLQKVEGKVVVRPDLKNELKPLWFRKDTGVGAVVIYESPITAPPRNMYAMGYDPYRQDIGTSNGAVYVYKKANGISSTQNKIVASYIGRPATFDTFNYTVEMLSELYNCDIMYENEVPDVVTYFRNRNKLHYLALQPDSVITGIVGNSKVKRVYGMHMTDKIKDAGEKYIKKWLLTVIDFDEFGNEITNLDKLEDVGLIEELIKYSRKGNFDRVCAFFQIMFQLQADTNESQYQSREDTEESIFDRLLNMTRHAN